MLNLSKKWGGVIGYFFAGISLLLLLVVSVASADLIGPVAASDDSAFSSDLFADDLYADEEDSEVYDPLERINRGTFWFNDKCYFYLLKPIARGFRIVPLPVRTGLGKMFDNLKSPIRAFNALFQGSFKQAGTETTRLIVNSTLGLAGFYDPADHFWNLKKKDEDFGQTLGYYGVGEGFYVVIPFLGASNVRDGLSLVPDSYTALLPWWTRFEVSLAIKSGEMVNRLSLDKDTYESIIDEQLDPYLFVRDAYTQNRRAKVID